MPLSFLPNQSLLQTLISFLQQVRLINRACAIFGVLYLVQIPA